MAELPITINGRQYRVACSPGEEPRLLAMAGDLDRRVEALTRSFGQAGESQLLILAALLLTDALDEAQTEIDRLKPLVPPSPGQAVERLSGTADLLDTMAERVESLVARLEAVGP